MSGDENSKKIPLYKVQRFLVKFRRRLTAVSGCNPCQMGNYAGQRRSSGCSERASGRIITRIVEIPQDFGFTFYNSIFLSKSSLRSRVT